MKQRFSSLMIGAVVALSSCSKLEEAPNPTGNQIATFRIEAPVATRATVAGLSRYIVEAYEGKDLTTTPVRAEEAIGTLTLTLKKNTDYTFLFWADKGTATTESVVGSGYYNTATLQQVAVTTNEENTIGEVAYCLSVSFNSKDFEANKSITLKNATAQVNFVEAAGLTAAGNTMTIKYSSGCTLNVATGAITENRTAVLHTYTDISKITADGVLMRDYILAPLGEKRILNLQVTLNSEPEKTITNVPLQQSYKTNIKGEYSNLYASVFTISNEVDDYESNPDVDVVEKPSVGSFFYADKTFSSRYNRARGCVGIIFYVNADGKSGKIVSLDQTTGNWTKASTWQSSKRLPAGMTWSCPTKDELQYLNCAYIGIAPETWDSYPSVSAVAGAKVKFNALLTTANGTGLLNSAYWSSTEVRIGQMWVVDFWQSQARHNTSTNTTNIRAVSTF